MSKADFSHAIEHHAGRNVIVIDDLKLGGISVASDIKAVVADICTMEKINAAEYMIVYKDYFGAWDGWDISSGRLIPLQEESWKDAVSKYAHIQVKLY